MSVVLLLIFLGWWVAHLVGGTREYNEEQALSNGKPPISVWQFLHTSQFRFQSRQNWQSEFLAVGSLVVLGIFLRQHGSPRFKPVTAAHHVTGES